ncbi:MAG TPA: type II toxin-antitoxin system VapB family antitoxin [Acidimicrobiia bacterium]|nr:type II toxin-antitoxin system VapB family antitoxin [Acidimicrobiia bacterium]
MGRTTIDVDDELAELVMRRLGVATKPEAVELALRLVAEKAMTTEAPSMRGAQAITQTPMDTAQRALTAKLPRRLMAARRLLLLLLLVMLVMVIELLGLERRPGRHRMPLE